MAIKKILFLVPDIQPNGGIQRFNKNIVQTLNLGDLYTYKVIALNESSNQNYFGASKSKRLFAFWFLKELLHFRPDIVLIGHLHFVPLAKVKYFFPKLKIICVLHGYEAWIQRTDFYSAFRSINRFWAVSHFTKNSFAKQNEIAPARIDQIFNTLPYDWTTEVGKIQYQNYFLTVTRLEKIDNYKGIDQTLRAMALMKILLAEEALTFIIVASGDSVEDHKKLAQELKIDHLVVFKSTISDKELKELYANCAFFILPSKREGFGIVYLEAMLYKKACIGAANCGAADPIEHTKTGFLLEPCPKQIAKKMTFLIQNKDRCISMGEAGYQRLVERFSFLKFKQLIHELLH